MRGTIALMYQLFNRKGDKMELKIIKTKKQYQEYLDWIDKAFDKKVKPNSPAGEKLQVALLLVKQYEDQHFPIPVPDPIDAIKLKMQEKGMKNKDLVGKVGTKGYISAILNKRKPLTLELARLFHKELNIPAEVLLSSPQ
jgi:HTH-type transcriptional regulator / antitoxin HigA